MYFADRGNMYCWYCRLGLCGCRCGGCGYPQVSDAEEVATGREKDEKLELRQEPLMSLCHSDAEETRVAIAEEQAACDKDPSEGNQTRT